jgi:hypothetical protein
LLLVRPAHAIACDDPCVSTDYEPYVAEPAEPARPQTLARLRTWIAWLAALVLVAALAFLWADGRGEEDPSLQIPAEQLEASRTAPGRS